MAQADKIYKSWTELKLLIVSPKSLKLQYHQYTYRYHIFVLEAGVEYSTELWTDTSQVKGVNVTQNNIDLADFVNNYKAGANLGIDLDVNVQNDIVVSDFGSGASVDANISGDVTVDAFKDFYFEVARGNVNGHSNMHSIGERPDVEVHSQGIDVWTGDEYIIPIPDQVDGEQLSIVSTSDDDTDNSGSIGARKIDLHYLDKDGIQYEVEILLNGTTPVDTIATNIRFVQFMHVTEVGSNTVAVGDITIYRKTDSDRVYSKISVGGNMALSNHRMIPAGYTYYLKEWSASATGTKRVAIRLRATAEHGIIRPGVFLFQDTCNLLDSVYVKAFAVPICLPEFSIVKTSLWTSVGGVNAYVSAGFRGVLIENESGV